VSSESMRQHSDVPAFDYALMSRNKAVGRSPIGGEPVSALVHVVMALTAISMTVHSDAAVQYAVFGICYGLCALVEFQRSRGASTLASLNPPTPS